jgi:tRNA threonylcarbamoyladenosine dehydratase
MLKKKREQVRRLFAVDERFSRNLGLLTPAQQKRLLEAKVLIAGVGGMGGVAAEVLARVGVGSLTLIDPDVFERTNLNRQIHSHEGVLSQPKVGVLAKAFRKIAPELKVKSVHKALEETNIQNLLHGADCVLNGMDEMMPSLVLERTAREQGIPIVDAWLTPYASVFTMMPTDPHWEEFLDFPTHGVPLDQLTKKQLRGALKKEVAYTFSHFEPKRWVKSQLVKRVLSGRQKRPSLAPVVWLSGVLMANEALKVLLGLPTVGPRGLFLDQYTGRLMRGRRTKKKAA